MQAREHSWFAEALRGALGGFLDLDERFRRESGRCTIVSAGSPANCWPMAGWSISRRRTQALVYS